MVRFFGRKAGKTNQYLKNQHVIHQCTNTRCYYAKLTLIEELNHTFVCPRCQSELTRELVTEEEAYQKGFIQYANRPISGRKISPPPPIDLEMKRKKKQSE